MPNVYDDPCEYDDVDPPGFRAGWNNVGRAAGGTALNVKLYEVPPGEHSNPYHYEYEEEWLLVLSGSVVLRTPQGERPLAAGELVCFAPGPTGAHRVTNRSSDTVRLLLWSSAREPAFAVYPDSDKVGVWSGGEGDDVMLHRRDGSVPYWEGESP